MADGGGISTIGGVNIDVQAGVGRFNTAMTQVQQRARQAGSAMTSEFDKADRSAQRLEATLKRGVSALALFGVGFTAGTIVKGIIDTADSLNLLKGRLTTVISENERLESVWGDIFNAAQRNRAALDATAELYIKLRQSVRELNHEQAIGLTSTFQQALVLSGTNAQTAAAATYQFAQAMSKGKLDGDEFRTQMEVNSRFVLGLADALGVTKGELQALAEAGALTSGVIQKAMADQAVTIQAEFSQMPTTVGQAFQQLTNALQNYIGDTDKALGINARLAQGISFLTKNMQELGDAAIALTAGAGAGAAVFAGFKGVDALGKSFTAIRVALIDLAGKSNPVLHRFSEQLTKAFLDSEQAAAAYQGALRKVATAEENLAAAQKINAGTRSIGAFKGVVTRAKAFAGDMRGISEDMAANFEEVQTRYRKAATGVVGTFQRIGSAAKSVGISILDAFGGPVGLAITAAAIAMFVFTQNALKAAEAARNIHSALQLVADMNIDVSNAASDAAGGTEKLNSALANQARAVEALAVARRKENREILQRAILDTREQLKTESFRAKDRAGSAFGLGDDGADTKKASEEAKRLTDDLAILEAGLAAIDAGTAKFGDDTKKAAEEVDAATKALQAYQRTIEIVRNHSTQDPKTKSAIASAALETLAKTDLPRALQEFPSIKDLLTPKDAIDVEKKLIAIRKASMELTIDGKKGFNEYRTAAEEFAKSIKEIQTELFIKPEERSRAAIAALIDYAKELKNIPAAMAAANGADFKKLARPKDLAAGLAEIRKQALDQTSGVGDDQTQAWLKFADAIQKVNEAEAALNATGQNSDTDRFEKARANIQQELDDTLSNLKGPKDDFADLIELMESMQTPLEKIQDAYAKLGWLQNTSTDAGQDAQTAFARKRISLLEDEARIAGYAADALAKLKLLQDQAGLSPMQARQAREGIDAAAAAGRAGRQPGELSKAAAREGAVDIFATSFRDAMVAGIKSGDFGAAVRDTIATKAAEGLADAFLDIGKLVGKFLFTGDGPIAAMVGDFFGFGDVSDLGASTASATLAASAEFAAGGVGTLGTAAGLAAIAIGALSAAATTAAAVTGGDTASDLVGTAVSLLAGHAHGGRVVGGVPIVTGEAGREIFVPDGSGTIIPNSALTGAASHNTNAGRTKTVIVKQGDLNVHGDVSTREQIQELRRAQMDQLKLIPRAVRGVIKDKERRT